jgi:GT2 family glycosyltransferase
MISVVFSTHKSPEYNESFINHLKETSGLKDIQILMSINIRQFSLSEVYNKGLEESIHDIVVFLHNDIKLSKNWGRKLLKDFQDNSEYAILGKAGSVHFPESCVYWEKLHLHMVGEVWHKPKDKHKFLSRYSDTSFGIIPVVTVDGVFIAIDKTKIVEKFDEEIQGFHFYDHGFCLPNYLQGVKIGVTNSFELIHESIGQTNQEFEFTKGVFKSKYGEKLPITLYPERVKYNPINIRPSKNDPSLAIIIPHKNHNHLLFNAIDSIFEISNYENFKIYVADTGSDEDKLTEIKEKYSDNPKVKLIEFDYYNFARINNEVVFNHLDNEELILFMNNDVKLINDAISECVKEFKINKTVGTVGIRLHFEDNTIQHAGVFAYTDSNKTLQIGHHHFKSHYNFWNFKKNLVGNTGAFLMIRNVTFKNLGGFSVCYVDCLEDVELNLKCLLSNLKNVTLGNAVAYHFESVTRNENPEKEKLFQQDYQNLLNFVIQNKDRLLPIWQNIFKNV